MTALLCLEAAARGAEVQAQVRRHLDGECPGLVALYQHLHAHPELSFQETQTAARVALELRQAGYEVTTGVGKLGVVGVLRRGAGKTLLLRADMDALPVKEQTGLAYASTVTARDAQGEEVPVMHACGHDLHMTWVLGAAKVLALMKDQWHGTLVVVGQPAEEAGGGARAMIRDGLFERFPTPDACLALHDDAQLAAGTVGYKPGYSGANVDSVDILVRGRGGHGAHPERTKDPVVLSAQIILALQTIVSRETEPTEPAVVTVGTIHGGTKRNVIPDEVRLQLTVRSYSEAVRQQTLDAIRRIARGQALAAGVPEDRLPEIQVADHSTPALFNNVALTERVVGAIKPWLGETNLILKPPSMGGEDFAEFGRTAGKIPICMLDVGAANPKAVDAAKRTGQPLPPLHSPLWAPDPEPSIRAGITALTAAALDLLTP